MQAAKEMEASGLPFNINSREKKAKRREILEKKKAVDEVIRAACADKDHLASFSLFRQYDRNGLSVHLESGTGDCLSSPVKQYIQKLLKVNMEAAYGLEWSREEKVKRLEMVSPEARYIFVYLATSNAMSTELDKGTLVGFVHYRFTLEEELPVLYVYELQLESRVQEKGLGKFLMQLTEHIACKPMLPDFLYNRIQNQMAAVVLTVQKANAVAMKFYTSQLGYTISCISPSRVDPLMGIEMSYEILCKAFDHEAKVLLEASAPYDKVEENVA